MAVIPCLPGISVAVHNDQGQLPEHADAEPDIVKRLKSPPSIVVSNYIEAPPGGGPFWFKFRVEAPYIHGPHRIMFRYEIPGTGDNSGKSCGPEDLENRGSWETALKGYTGTDERGPVFRNFWFAKLRILPGEDQRNGITETEKSNMESVGTLQIRVLLGKRIGNRTFDDLVVHRPTVAGATEQVAAKKGLSLGISYTEKPLSAAAAAAWPSTFNNGWNNPIAIFQFKFRTRADLQRLQLIESAPAPGPRPYEDTVTVLPAALVPLCAPSLNPEPMQLLRENALPILPTIPVALRAPSSTPTSGAFEDLTFAEVRDLASNQHKGFDELNGDEIEKLARQKYSEEMAHVDDVDGAPSSSSLPRASSAFEDLKFDEVLDFARSQHKDFKELKWHEIRELAMQKHSETMASSRASASEAPDANNSQGKRKAQTKPEDIDEDIIFVSATKKRG